MASLSASDDPIDTFVQIERLAALLDGDIDVELDRKIEAALAEEQEEVREVLEESAAFRAWNVRLVYGISLAGLGVLVIGFLSFNTQIRQPIIRLKTSIDRLRAADYSTAVSLGGSHELRDLEGVLTSMAEGLAARETTRAEQAQQLEETVEARTVELQ